MKIGFLAVAVLVLGTTIGSAAETPMTGTIISETSVDCGTKKQGKKESTNLLCQQYTVRTATAEYLIRQPKSANKEILPANTPIELRWIKTR